MHTFKDMRIKDVCVRRIHTHWLKLCLYVLYAIVHYNNDIRLIGAQEVASV